MYRYVIGLPFSFFSLPLIFFVFLGIWGQGVLRIFINSRLGYIEIMGGYISKVCILG